ncbi:hypothetical protein P4493_04215 [Bacillus thuringiensis]|uniref:Uncharacterized protein n=3 Tax=Bacillus thuringiensis TaxID=1428 RepID=A0A0B5NIR5_BACTU|nr:MULTISPECIES: hypothetical protein [Bacillus]MEC2535481.1 hypothetical protein [Bacillus cereus]MED1153805.1 hypothetical protein [Bacillus paranthracis]OUB09335.1 hypothetical protein BK708_32950 [Bacillus thuringiensis serovar yunnanensis]AFQ30117.1 hypothetical protein BTF1_30082 [Bacillus thuringiensis HD-789]AJG73861.1 hypothetical protein BF38_5919 [Bacillus thuringiensis]
MTVQYDYKAMIQANKDFDVSTLENARHYVQQLSQGRSYTSVKDLLAGIDWLHTQAHHNIARYDGEATPQQLEHMKDVKQLYYVQKQKLSEVFKTYKNYGFDPSQVLF